MKREQIPSDERKVEMTEKMEDDVRDQIHGSEHDATTTCYKMTPES